MTATLSTASRREILMTRLDALRAERDRALAETIPSGAGDVADRATNVDGHVRLAMLEERIATVEADLVTLESPGARRANDGVAVGDIVTIDFGDGPETFLLGSVDEATDRFDVITPESPLGRALAGARPGSTIFYTAGPNRTLRTTVVSVE
jgi:transcription elongation factor GreA